MAAETGAGLVVLLDVDDFKSINDNFGNQVGDECLVACGAALRESVRTPDACYRWGGDEFAVLIRDGSHTGAEEAIFARIQRRLEASFQLPDGSTPRLTFGSSEFDDEAARSHGLLVAADMRLLERKRARKDARVGDVVALSMR